MHRPRRSGALRALNARLGPVVATAVATVVAGAAIAGGPGPGAEAQTAPSSPSPPSSPPSTTPMPQVKAAILVDVDTGRVLYQSNVHTPLPPGSLTKTLTAMIAADWLPSDAEVPVSALDANVYPDRVGMKPGQQWPLTTTLHALITDSANDAAYALAEDIGGSMAGFGPVMQKAATELGMEDHPVLHDPAGLDGKEGFQGGNLVSAWDLAVAGRDMMANPQLAAIAGQRTYDFTGPDGVSYHLLSRNYHFLAGYPGAIGIKTGFTDKAGYCDMEEAQSGGRRMLAVVLGSTNPDAAAADLITAGFSVAPSGEGGSPTLPAVTEPRPQMGPVQAGAAQGGPAPDPSTTVAAASPDLTGRAAAKDGSGPLVHGLEGAGVVLGIVGLTWTWRTRSNRRRWFW